MVRGSQGARYDCLLEAMELLQASPVVTSYPRTIFTLITKEFRRLLLAVVEWVRVYPGDFAFVAAREQLITFYREALSHAYLGHLSADLADSIGRLEHIRDLDESWSLAARLAKKNLSASGQASGNTPKSSASPYSGLDDTTLEALNAPKNADPIRGPPLARAQSTLSTSTKDSASAYAVISPSDASQMGRPSVSSPPISFGNGFGGSMGSQSMSRTETRAGRGSSEGSRSVSEVESEGSRPFLRSLTLLEGLSDLAVAVELSKEEWRLFSQIRVGLPACDRPTSRTILMFALISASRLLASSHGRRAALGNRTLCGSFQRHLGVVRTFSTFLCYTCTNQSDLFLTGWSRSSWATRDQNLVPRCTSDYVRFASIYVVCITIRPCAQLPLDSTTLRSVDWLQRAS
jgi:hypothetical protein